MPFFDMVAASWVSLAFLCEGIAGTQEIFTSRAGAFADMQHFHEALPPVSSFMAPVGLLGHRSDRRPGWGRDYGPDLGLPKHVSANPFGADATTPPPIQQPLANQLEPTATPTVGPAFNQSRVPGPPKKEPELSPSDQKEKAKHQATKLAGAVSPNTEMPESIPGKSCEDVCAACEIAKAQLKSGCYCSATCVVGPIGGKCGSDRAGWSDNIDSKPYQEWTATCGYSSGAGDFECASCLSQDFKYEMGNCTMAGTEEAKCLHKLREDLALNTAGRTFCFYKSLPNCQEFPKAPKPNDEEDVKWYCFDTLRTCRMEKARMSSYDEQTYDYQTKSVWKPIFESETSALR